MDALTCCLPKAEAVRQLISILIIIILLPSMSVECEDPMAEEPPYELPPITQKGANTFGCLINGEVWLPKSDLTRVEALRANYPFANRFYIDALNRIGNNDKFNFILIDSSNVWQAQRFDLTNRKALALNFEFDDCHFYNTTDRNGNIVAGELFVSKYNIRPEFISGTFWFTAVSDCDTVFVTEGRFDLPFTR